MEDISSGSRRGGRSLRRGQLWHPQQGRDAATFQTTSPWMLSANPLPYSSSPHPQYMLGYERMNRGFLPNPAAESSGSPSFTSQDLRNPVSHGHPHVQGDVRRRDDYHREEYRMLPNVDMSGRRARRGGHLFLPNVNAESPMASEGEFLSNEVSRRSHHRGDGRTEGHLRFPENETVNGSMLVDANASASNFARRKQSVRGGQSGRGVSRDHLSANGRQLWRPSSQGDRNGSDRPSRPGMLTSESLEASRGAVDEVLQHLAIRGDQGGGPNRKADMHRHQSSQKHVKNRVEPIKQGLGFGPSVFAVPKDKANTPQLVQELEDKLSKGQIECMICYDMVKREAAVWSCGGCYAIFHIACIRKWAKAPISADFSLSSSNQVSVGNWRCPGCQSPQFLSVEEIKYRCFCSQVPEPQVDYYLTPHSCGGPCMKSLSSAKSPHCKHVCTMQCHPGPCLPCNALAPPQFCPCGKMSYSQRCSELKNAKSCGQVCGHQLQCGRHYCQKICHEGPCGSCDTILTVNCFCGRKREAMACGVMGLQGELDWEHGVFSCENPCLRKLQCGKHACNKKCHPGHCGECELAPGKVQTCPCGKVSVEELLGVRKQRETCTDAVPRCGQICQKCLPCGKHVCQSLCHVGDCPACEVLVDQKCRCKATSQTMPCHKAVDSESDSKGIERDGPADEIFMCNRKCGKKKSCGRHRCSNRCCPLASDDNASLIMEDDPHLCSLPCGKKLRCGQHTCEELCHNGHCPPCLGSTFTELSCACGSTSIPPPVPCGTLPPSCPHPCSQPQPCGHTATHQCHFGECPPCIVLTAKECVGSHVTLRNVPCGSKDIKCNKLCGKPRQCGLHACARLCHLPPCEVVVDTGDDKIVSCGQQCGAPRRDCEHVCIALCHPCLACPETRCKFPVTITCVCGRLSQQVPCDAGENSKGNDMLELAYISSLLLQAVDGKARIPLGQRKLACDEDCAKLEKKRVLADAFGMTDVPADRSLSAESVQTASAILKELLIKDPQWILAIEDRFKYLVLGVKSATTPIRVHVFGFLPKEKRDVVRQMAERWHLTVSAVGREPKRFLTVHVNAKSRAPHMRMLFGRSALPLPGQAQGPAYNPSLDMDPRLVVGLFELPREGDISNLVLRFGGECELVWLNDKNALAVFSDVMRAATAIRRVDHASAYVGAIRLPLTSAAAPSVRGWGFNEGPSTSKDPSRKKNVQESSWSEDAWGGEWVRLQAKTAWDRKGPPISTTINPWGALDQDEAVSRNSTKVKEKPSSSSTASAAQQLKSAPTSIATDSWEDLDS